MKSGPKPVSLDQAGPKLLLGTQLDNMRDARERKK